MTHGLVYWYIFKKYCCIFFATVLSIAAIVLLFDVIELLRESSKKETAVAFSNILVMGLLKSPKMIYVVLPFSVLISSMILFFQLTKTSELIVIRSVGVSVWNFIAPVITATGILGILATTVFNPFAAWTSKKFDRMEERFALTSSNPFSFSEKGLWLREVQEDIAIVIKAARVRKIDQDVALDRITVFELSKENNLKRQIESSEGVIQNGNLLIKNAFVVDSVQEKGYNANNISFKTNFDLDKILEKFDSPETMSFWRFPKFIKFLEESGFSSLNHKVYWYSLLVFPFFLIAMSLIGTVFSLPRTMRQASVLIRIVLTLSCGFFVYFLCKVISVLGLSQSLPIFLSTFGPIFIVIPFCVTMLLHLEDG